MKNTTKYLLMLCTVLLASCNLFIDGDLERELMEYSGKGYDSITTIQTDEGTVQYQYKSTTMELNADNPLTRFILSVERIDSARAHIIYVDGATPLDLLPQEGQHIVSNNTEVFEYGLCALVALVKNEGSQYAIFCKDADIQDAFEYMSFHMSLPANDYLEEYDVYDEDGNFLFHVDNREENAREQTRGEEGDDYLNMNIPFAPVDISRTDEWKKKYHGDNFKIDITGGVKAKIYIDCDFDWDEGLNFSCRMKDGSFDIGLKLQAIVGMGDAKRAKLKGKYFGNDDLLKGRVKLTVGPVVVIPVFGFSVNYQVNGTLETEVSYHKPFDFTVGFKDGDFFSKDNNTKESKITAKFDAAAGFEFPVIKISVGFGLFTSDLSLRGEFYIRLQTKVTLATGIKEFGGDPDNPVHIDYNPKVNCDVTIGFAVSLVAKGMIISKVLAKIKEHVLNKAAKMKDAQAALEAMNKAWKAYEATGKISDWLAFKKGDLESIDPAILNEMRKLVPAGASDEERAGIIDWWLEKKTKEKAAIPTPPSDDDEGMAMRPLTDADNDKEFALRLGPVYLDKPKWTLLDSYLFPKMKEGSFKVGQKWTSVNDDIVFSGEWSVEDPGLITFVKTLYPCFTIMSGSDELFTLFPENEEDAKLTISTPANKKYKVEIPHLLAEYPYTCIPGYALVYDGRPVVQDKGLAFSTVTPTISIVKFVDIDQDCEPMNENVSMYTYYFDTYSNVKGSVNIKEWGIYDNSDINPFTARHKSKDAVLQSGNYVHHWSAKSLKAKIQVDLSPYIFGRDAANTITIANAKMFPAFKKKIKYKYNFADDSRRSTRGAQEAGDEDDGYSSDYTLTLDSVTYEGKRIL